MTAEIRNNLTRQKSIAGQCPVKRSVAPELTPLTQRGIDNCWATVR
jgi:hypothetical protein